MSRSRICSLALGLALVAPAGVARAQAELFFIESIENILGEDCEDYDAPFSGLEDFPLVGVTDQGLTYGAVVCADPNDLSKADRVMMLPGFAASGDWVGTPLETWSQADPTAPNDLRQVDVTSDGMVEQYDDRVVYRPLLSNPFGVGAREGWIVEPFDVAGTTYDSPITSRVLPGGKVLAQMFYLQGEAIVQAEGAGGAIRSVKYSTPQLVPGGQTANFIAPNWAANEQGEILASLEQNLGFSLGIHFLDENRLLFGVNTPVAGGPPASNPDFSSFDIGEDRGLFVDASASARLLTRDLSGTQDAQVEDTAQIYGNVDLWNTRAALGLPPGDRLSVVSSDGISVGARVRWSPFQTAIQSGDVLDGKTVQIVQLGTRSTAADVAIVVVTFTDFSESYYLIAKLTPNVPALPGAWGVALLPLLLVAVAIFQVRRRSSGSGTR